MKDDTQFPEAGAVVYFYYKRTDGFEVSLTLRDKSGKDVLKRLDGAIGEVVKLGGTPLPLRGTGFTKQAKPIDYVPDKKCPKCGNRLVYAATKAGKKFMKCETNKWDFTLKQSTGCPYVEWGDSPSEPPVRDINDY
jgi:hypothetical protein